MEVRDGFIIGISNYCDRWCETCAFTSRCRLFADAAEIEAKLDPGLKEIVDAPPLPEDVPSPPPQWMKEMIAEMNAATEDPALDALQQPRREPPPEHLLVESRADDYFTRVHAWVRERSFSNDPTDPCAVITWFHLQIMVKMHRAIHGLAEDGPGPHDWPPDHDGSAKVALIGIDRSHAAWLELADRGNASQGEVAPFIADLVWLGESLERIFPKARAFVRPGLDEPDAVSMLLAREGNGLQT
jgi:hypothetical protein